MPTKTEQADLLEVLYGRNGECPVAVVAVSQPDDAFDTTVEACRIALEHMTPVFLLSDGYIGNGSQPWKIVESKDLPVITRPIAKGEDYQPFARDEKTLARFLAVPGMKGMEHRIGGLEKQDGAGNISYDPDNHELMTKLRAEKIERIADFLPPSEVVGPDSGELLLVTWGSTRGAVAGAVKELEEEGTQVAHLHLRHLNPFPKDFEAIMKRYKKVLIPELNTGQLRTLVRSRYLLDVQGLSKVQGQPFKVREIKEAVMGIIAGNDCQPKSVERSAECRLN
jgi:2-oxoglutarate ferredoxin oxidoreductase subunit alpha